MKGKTTNYYAGGNTAKGFYNLFESNLEGLNRLFVLKGGPGTGKSYLMRQIGKYWLRHGYDIEYMHCSSDNHSIDGVIITELKAGIVDGTAPHVIEPKFVGVTDDYVDLSTGLDTQSLKKNKDKIISLTLQVSEAFQSAYRSFAKALVIHDEWESIYIKNMNFQKAEKLADNLSNTLVPRKKTTAQAEVRHRFLGAATPEGPVDFIPQLTAGIPTRYFLKGRPGSGKSTLLKKLGNVAKERGFDVEVYHCGFDPESVDMIIVRELGFAVFDSTAPHEHFPTRKSDEVIDLYAEVISPGTDEQFASKLDEVAERYSAKMKEGTAFLAKAKALRDQLEGYYMEAMDFDVVDEAVSNIQAEFRMLLQN